MSNLQSRTSLWQAFRRAQISRRNHIRSSSACLIFEPHFLTNTTFVFAGDSDYVIFKFTLKPKFCLLVNRHGVDLALITLLFFILQGPPQLASPPGRPPQGEKKRKKVDINISTCFPPLFPLRCIIFQCWSQGRLLKPALHIIARLQGCVKRAQTSFIPEKWGSPRRMSRAHVARSDQWTMRGTTTHLRGY